MTGIKGVGGLFLRANDKKALMDWYKDKLGINMEEWGAVMQWKDHPKSEEQYNVFSIFDKDNNYFNIHQRMMINFIVVDMDNYKLELEAKGVTILGSEESEYGKFCWVEDPDGNKIELWEK
jgi:D-3-phosphoglycerate dehydrogenase / 2-oxoglutarate reductase